PPPRRRGAPRARAPAPRAAGPHPRRHPPLPRLVPEPMTPYRPRLRSNVDPATLVDTVKKIGIDLGAAAALLGDLDGSHDLDALVADDPGRATALRRLLCINAVEGAGDAIVDRIDKI